MFKEAFIYKIENKPKVEYQLSKRFKKLKTKDRETKNALLRSLSTFSEIYDSFKTSSSFFSN